MKYNYYLLLSLIISSNAFSMEWFNYFKKKEPTLEALRNDLEALRKDRTSFLSCLPGELYQELMKYNYMKDPSVFWALLEHKKQAPNGLLEQMIMTGAQPRHFALDGKYLYSALANGQIIKIDLEQRTQTTIHMLSAPLQALYIDKKNDQLILIEEQGIEIWDLNHNTSIGHIKINGIFPFSFFDKSTNILFIGEEEGVKIIDLNTGNTKQILEKEGRASSLAFDSKNKKLFVAVISSTPKIIVWDLEKNSIDKTFKITGACHSLYYIEMTDQLILQLGFHRKLLDIKTEQCTNLSAFHSSYEQFNVGPCNTLHTLIFMGSNNILSIFDVEKKKSHLTRLDCGLHNPEYIFDQENNKLYIGTLGDIRIYSLHDPAMKAEFEQQITLDRLALLKAIYAAFLDKGINAVFLGAAKLDLTADRHLLNIYNQWPLIHSFLDQYVILPKEHKDETKVEPIGSFMRRPA